jgi:serine/threonine protein kinase
VRQWRFEPLSESALQETPPIRGGGDRNAPASQSALDTLVPRPLPLPVVAAIASRLVRTLAYLHALGIAHRDLKAENIVMAPSVSSSRHGKGEAEAEKEEPGEGGGLGMVIDPLTGCVLLPFRPQLIDFATASDLLYPRYNARGNDRGKGAGASTSTVSSAAAANFQGTPDFMPPEAVGTGGLSAPASTPAPAPASVTVDTRGDLWALGCLVHQLAFGVPPFRAGVEGLFETLSRVARYRDQTPAEAGTDLDALIFPPPPPWPPSLHEEAGMKQVRGQELGQKLAPAEAESTPARLLLDFILCLLRRDPARRLGVVGAAPNPSFRRPPAAELDPFFDTEEGDRLTAGWMRRDKDQSRGQGSSAPDQQALFASLTAIPGDVATPMPEEAWAALPAMLPRIDYSAILAHPFLVRYAHCEQVCATDPTSEAHPSDPASYTPVPVLRLALVPHVVALSTLTASLAALPALCFVLPGQRQAVASSWLELRARVQSLSFMEQQWTLHQLALRKRIHSLSALSLFVPDALLGLGAEIGTDCSVDVTRFDCALAIARCFRIVLASEDGAQAYKLGQWGPREWISGGVAPAALVADFDADAIKAFQYASNLPARPQYRYVTGNEFRSRLFPARFSSAFASMEPSPSGSTAQRPSFSVIHVANPRIQAQCHVHKKQLFDAFCAVFKHAISMGMVVVGDTVMDQTTPRAIILQGDLCDSAEPNASRSLIALAGVIAKAIEFTRAAYTSSGFDECVVIFAGKEGVSTTAALLRDSPERTPAMLCTAELGSGCWVGGLRLFVSDPSVILSSKGSDAQSSHCGASSWLQERLELSSAASQHSLLVSRGAMPTECMTDSILNHATSSEARTNHNVRAILSPESTSRPNTEMRREWPATKTCVSGCATHIVVPSLVVAADEAVRASFLMSWVGEHDLDVQRFVVDIA